jgi:hypothetical protein
VIDGHVLPIIFCQTHKYLVLYIHAEPCYQVVTLRLFQGVSSCEDEVKIEVHQSQNCKSKLVSDFELKVKTDSDERFHSANGRSTT